VRHYLLAGITKGRSGISTAVLQARQGSAMLSATAASSGMIVIAQGRERLQLDDLVESCRSPCCSAE
jgi:molybdopterin biosynthesis enzyme